MLPPPLLDSTRNSIRWSLKLILCQTVICNFWHPGTPTLTLSAERRSARMSLSRTFPSLSSALPFRPFLLLAVRLARGPEDRSKLLPAWSGAALAQERHLMIRNQVLFVSVIDYVWISKMGAARVRPPPEFVLARQWTSIVVIYKLIFSASLDTKSSWFDWCGTGGSQAMTLNEDAYWGSAIAA